MPGLSVVDQDVLPGFGYLASSKNTGSKGEEGGSVKISYYITAAVHISYYIIIHMFSKLLQQSSVTV